MAHTETDCELRLLTESDAAAYRALRLESLLHAPEVFEAAYEDQMDKTDDDCQNFWRQIRALGILRDRASWAWCFSAATPDAKHCTAARSLTST